jgi:hypothetical protein
MQLNKIWSIKTIAMVAQELGEDEDWLHEISIEMEPEDGVIWVYGVGEEGVPAFSEFGVENLLNLIEIHRQAQK